MCLGSADLINLIWSLGTSMYPDNMIFFKPASFSATYNFSITGTSTWAKIRAMQVSPDCLRPSERNECIALGFDTK